MPLVQFGMKTNSAYPTLLTKSGHSRLCVISSTSSGIEISVNEEKISKYERSPTRREASEERNPASPFTKRTQVEPLMLEYLRHGSSRGLPPRMALTCRSCRDAALSSRVPAPTTAIPNRLNPRYFLVGILSCHPHLAFCVDVKCGPL